MSAFFICCYVSLGIADQEAIVSYVIDGDTVILAGGERIRLIGINAPELESDNQAAQPYSLEARLALAELVMGRDVELKVGEEKYDRYGRTLAYILIDDDIDVQVSLLEKGYAAVIAIPPNIQRVNRYLSAEKLARSSQLGIWSNDGIVIDISNSAQNVTTGFNIVQGRVVATKRLKNNYLLNLENKLNVLINYDAWADYWSQYSINNYVDKRIEVRGWITQRNQAKWLRISHPSMLVER